MQKNYSVNPELDPYSIKFASLENAYSQSTNGKIYQFNPTSGTYSLIIDMSKIGNGCSICVYRGKFYYAGNNLAYYVDKDIFYEINTITGDIRI